MAKTLVVLTGPTAVGKTDLSIDLALHFNAPIISADSRQFYKELVIGSAFPLPEQLAKVQHHFIGNFSVTQYYNSFQFEKDALELIQSIFTKRDIVFLCGGSGMYIDAVCNGIDDIPDVDLDIRNELLQRLKNDGIEELRLELKMRDPVYYAQVDLKNGQRIVRALEVCIMTGLPFSGFRTSNKKERDFKIIKVALNRNRDELHTRINNRVDAMLEMGLVNEARSVLKYRHHYALKTVGYRELFDFFDENISLETAIELIKRNTRRFARKQISWFNRDSEYNWFHPDEKEKIVSFIQSELLLA